jgi:hypothetical protein
VKHGANVTRPFVTRPDALSCEGEMLQPLPSSIMEVQHNGERDAIERVNQNTLGRGMR